MHVVEKFLTETIYVIKKVLSIMLPGILQFPKSIFYHSPISIIFCNSFISYCRCILFCIKLMLYIISATHHILHPAGNDMCLSCLVISTNIKDIHQTALLNQHIQSLKCVRPFSFKTQEILRMKVC